MKILLAYDGFPQSDHALERTVELAAEDGGEVTVMSVVPPDARGSKSGGHVGIRPHAHEDVARAHESLAAQGIASEMRIEHGEPSEEILRVAEEGGYDLVVVGSRGLGRLGRLMLGSVSTDVVSGSSRPVLVVAKDGSERIEPGSATTG
jgi:nucleotide-binding universal stress UspA family protein